MQAPETSKHLESADQVITSKVATWTNSAKPVENLQNEINLGLAKAEDLLKVVLKDVDVDRGDYNVIYGKPKMPPRKFPSAFRN
jgi:hypothetical protein